MKKVIFLIIVVLFFAQAVFAHHPWVEKEGDRFKIAWGHPPKADPYDPDRVKDIKAFDLKGKEIPFTRIDEKDKAYVSTNADVSMITVSFEGGFLVTTPEGKKRLTKRAAQKASLQVVDSFYSSQFVKSLFGYSDAITKPVGMKFEIVPLKNPFTLKAEELLPVKVLFEGKPLEGITVEIGKHKEVGKTNKDGIADIKVTGQGIQVILAKHRVPAKDNPDADYLSFTTVLTLESK